jgi:hypothetical protein
MPNRLSSPIFSVAASISPLAAPDKNALPPLSGYFLNFFPGFAHLFEPHNLPAYLSEFACVELS